MGSIRLAKTFTVTGLLILTCLFSARICAEETSDNTGFSKLLDKLSSGSIEYKSFWQFDKIAQDRRRFLNEAMLKLDIEHDIGEQNSIYLNPVFRVDLRDFSSGIIDEPRETNIQRYHINFKEAYWVRYGESSDFYMGKKIYTWGKAEGFNPTDSINPYDFLDFPDREKIGVLSASLEYSVKDYLFDFLFIPFFTPSRIPEIDNRWAGNIQGEPLTGWTGLANMATTTATLQDRQLPSESVCNIQFASRMRTTSRGWDFSLSYYHGFDSMPVVEQDTANPLNFIPVYNRIDKYGLAVATTFDKLEVHVEAAYRDTESSDDDDFIAYIMGGSYSWDDFELELVEKINLYLEYAGEKITRYKTNNRRFSSAYARPLKRSLLGGIVFEFSEDTDLRVTGNYNTDEYDFYIQPKLTHKFSDRLKLNTGFDILSGHEDTFWGKWSKNDRIFMFVMWYL